MGPTTIPASFEPDDSRTTTADRGQVVHEASLAQMERLREQLYEVRPGVWCMVGNGLSNQTFVEGPEGLIVIDTGESQEEMAAALAAVRDHTDAPVAAVIYTHFHYCNGTSAVVEPGDATPIWGHELIPANLARTAAETGPVGARGVIGQFGVALPPDGPDALVGVGLGRFFKNPAHGRGTAGYLAATHTISERTETTIAGLDIIMTPAPSDATDSITIFFPALDLCVNNLVWPALFNVFAIRGEAYRDPRIVIDGIDEITSFDPEHLVCTHGPPLSGRDEIRAGVRDARDAIQYLWDQTVRGINKGLTVGELIAEVQLPARFERSHLTQQHYGLAEHHVRQIHAGLLGWFDGYEAELFPHSTPERCRRLIDGFGGRATVAEQARTALDDGHVRWALELATWLVRSGTAEDGRADGGSADERALLAEVLRTIAGRTTSANIRNWCLTRAGELEGTIDLDRHRRARFSRDQVLRSDPATFVHALKTLVDPVRIESADLHLAFVLDGTTTGLHLRGSVAVPTDGADAAHRLTTTMDTWADVLAERITLADAVASGAVTIAGEASAVVGALTCIEHPSFAR